MPFASWALLTAALPVAFAWKDLGRPMNDAYAAWSMDYMMVKYTVWVWAAVVGVLLIYRITLALLRHIRRIANLNHGSASDSKQRYFSMPNERWASMKRHFIVAPLFRKRHNREFRLS